MGILVLRETKFVTGTVLIRIVIPVENRIKNMVKVRLDSPCHLHAVRIILHRKECKTCRLLRSKLLYLR